MSETRLIVGLGNPGDDYTYTRHNLGFLILDEIGQKTGLRFKQSSSVQGLTAEGKIKSQEVYLLKPLTFVNLSGLAVKSVIAQKEIPLENILIICDDLHLDFGQLRLRPHGKDGGHNGLTSIIEQLKTENFPRLRVGIGQAKQKENTVNFVLGKFTNEEGKQLGAVVESAAACTVSWLSEGINKAMNQFNKRNGDE